LKQQRQTVDEEITDIVDSVGRARPGSTSMVAFYRPDEQAEKAQVMSFAYALCDGCV
jgi:hypothetical protein